MVQNHPAAPSGGGSGSRESKPPPPQQPRPQQADTNLLAFHFSHTPPPANLNSGGSGGGGRQRRHTSAAAASGYSNNNSSNRSNNNSNHPTQKKKASQTAAARHQSSRRPTAPDRASARRQASRHMFPLHSSPDHAFCLSRRPRRAASTALSAAYNDSSNDNNNNDNDNTAATGVHYTFTGPDRAVSWEAVRSVKHLVPAVAGASDDPYDRATAESMAVQVPCPICLDHLTAARITKCGHCFCLPCLIHHVQSSTSSSSSTAAPSYPKCPCCAIPLHLSDVRPVQFVTITAPPVAATSTTAATTTMRFVKLHRSRDCPAPYLPRPDQPRRSAPHAAPCATDPDAPYCRFNYLDVAAHAQLLRSNLQELQQLLQQQQSSSSSMMDPLDGACHALAVRMVQHDYQQQCVADAPAERDAAAQFRNPAAGVYQPQQSQQQQQWRRPRNPHTVPLLVPTVSPSIPSLSSSSSSWDVSPPSDVPLSTISTAAAGEPQRSAGGGDHEPTTSDNVLTARTRGDSIASCGASTSSARSNDGSVKLNSLEKHLDALGGSMYANDDDDEHLFYQAHDGSLCFLSAFNMNCLRTEFATTAPLVVVETVEQLSLDSASPPTSSPRQPQKNARPPLPDVVEGKVLEVERVQLTADLRQRRRFLSHLPLHADICFVEINLSHVLSNKTKRAFKAEFQKRNQIRLSNEMAERRADERLQRLEEERIDERKARMQRVDPADEFFHSKAIPPEIDLTGEDFGPSVLASPIAVTRTVGNGAVGGQPPGISFSQMCRSGPANDFPSLTTPATASNFPALGSAPPGPKSTKKFAPPPRPWGNSLKAAPPGEPSTSAAAGADSADNGGSFAGPTAGGKKTKGKKIVLFSTGGQRGDYF